MLGGGAMCAQDVPPFSIAQGDRARLYGLNVIGLRRAGFRSEAMSALKEAWRVLFVGDLPKRTAIAQIQASLGTVPEVAELVAFLESSERGVCRAALS
jgi:UDP-N-acetylglucosamine acyltransferase